MATKQRWVIVHKVVLAAVLPVLSRLPYRLAHRLLGWMGQLDLIVVPGQRRLYESAVARAARRLGERWEVRAVSQALGRQTYRWRARDIFLDRLSEHQVAALFRVEGRDHLDAALSAGRGVILLANHFGAHVLIAHWMFRQGYPLRWFGERPRSVSEYLRKQLRSEGPLGQDGLYVSRRTPMSEAASTIVRLAKILSAGLIVKVACDVRWRGGKVATVDFLGQPETLASVWVHLAAKTGAAVVPVFCRPGDDGTYQLEFQPSFQIPADAARNGQDARWVRAAIAAIEDHVRRHPEQSNDYFFWDPSDARLPVPAPTAARAARDLALTR